MTKGKGKGKNMNKRSRFVVMLKRTLQDLAIDIDKTEAGSEASRNLLDALSPLRNDQIVGSLKNHDSELYKAIPLELLRSPAGKAYLDILSLVTDFPEDDTSLDVVKVANSGVFPDFPESIQNLAAELQQELQFPDDVSQIDIADMFNKVTEVMNRKTQNGEINLSELQKSSQAVLDQIENSPALSSLLANPDLLSSLL